MQSNDSKANLSCRFCALTLDELLTRLLAVRNYVESDEQMSRKIARDIKLGWLVQRTVAACCRPGSRCEQCHSNEQLTLHTWSRFSVSALCAIRVCWISSCPAKAANNTVTYQCRSHWHSTHRRSEVLSCPSCPADQATGLSSQAATRSWGMRKWWQYAMRSGLPRNQHMAFVAINTHLHRLGT